MASAAGHIAEKERKEIGNLILLDLFESTFISQGWEKVHVISNFCIILSVNGNSEFKVTCDYWIKEHCKCNLTGYPLS